MHERRRSALTIPGFVCCEMKAQRLTGPLFLKDLIVNLRSSPPRVA